MTEEQELSTDEILSSIRHMLTKELGEERAAAADAGEIFLLTPDMRCADEASEQRMSEMIQKRTRQVLDRLTQESVPAAEKETLLNDLRPALKEWLDTHLAASIDRLIAQEIQRLLNPPKPPSA